MSYVEFRRVCDDYTLRVDNKIYQIARKDIRAGLRGADVRVELRLDSTLEVRFGEHYLEISECLPRPKVSSPPSTARHTRKPAVPRAKSQWMKNFHLGRPDKTALAPAGESSPVQAKSKR